jgi:glycosyltransferase involved in cell wall biosynthesis
MRIALFTEAFDQINGVSNTLKRIVGFAKENEYNLDVHTYGGSQLDCEAVGPVRIFRYPFVFPIPYYSDMSWDGPTLRRRILKNCEQQKYDLIHVVSPGSIGLNAQLLAHRLKLPLLGTYHTAIPEYTRPRVANFCARLGLAKYRLGDRAETAMWKYISWFYGRCRLVLAPSHAVKKQLEQRLKTRVEVFSRGIDTEQFHPRYRVEPLRPTALYVGRISVEKDLDVLVRIARERPNLRLVIVGDGPYKRVLQEKLPCAEFPGFLTGEALSRAYASADVFLFPSRTDTFGNVVLEAKSSGLPVIVSDQMGPAELVQDGKDGFIAPTEEIFGKRLDELLSRPALRQIMGQNSRAYAMGRSWNSVLGKLFEAYRTVLRAEACAEPALSRAASQVQT